MTEDHLVACNPLWQMLLSTIENEKTQLTMARIGVSTLIPGVNLTLVTNELYAFIGTIIGTTVHKKRLRLAGGERGNGF